MLTENKNVLREDLKTLKYSACLFSAEKEFLSFGATEEKAWSPIERKRVIGIVNKPESEERRLRLGVQTVKSSVRHTGTNHTNSCILIM